MLIGLPIPAFNGLNDDEMELHCGIHTLQHLKFRAFHIQRQQINSLDLTGFDDGVHAAHRHGSHR